MLIVAKQHAMEGRAKNMSEAWDWSVLRTARVHVFAGLLTGLVVAFVTLDARFLAGTGPRWEHPRPDLALYLTSASYFLADRWRLPLFDLPMMGYPEGGSVVYNDGVPIAALAAKALATTTGFKFNYLGPWVLLCYLAMGAFVSRVAWESGNRSVLASIALPLLVFSSTAFALRIEHIALSSQFLIIWALLTYVRAWNRTMRAWEIPLLMVVAVLVNAYLFAMVATLVFAALVTAWGRVDG